MVSSFEEVDREALRSFAEAAGRSAAETLTGMAHLGRALRLASAATSALRMRLQPAGLPEPHTFSPDLDLRCSVRRCRLSPEEHSLW